MPNTNVFTLDEMNKILEQLNAHPGARLQYIGSRYVPIFGRKGEDSIEWDNSGTYEPLTIVLYQGNSYTSRQFVPVGIEITNQEYWANTGNYNAQIEQYRQEVHQLSEDVTEMKDDVAANTSAIAAEREARENADTKEQEARENADTIIKADIASVKETVADNQEQVDKTFPVMEAKMASAAGGYDVYVCTVDTPGITENTDTVLYLNRVTNMFNLKADLSITDSLPTNTVLIKGLPKPVATANVRLIFGINYPASGNFVLSGASINENGELRTNVALENGYRLMFSFPVAAHNFGNEYDAYPRVPSSTVSAAVSTFKSYQGKYSYSNNIAKRLDPSGNATDCSGAIAMAFRENGVGNFPTYSDSIFGQGRLVSFAQKGETLDISDMQAGDVMVFSEHEGFDNYHVALAVSPTEVWEQNSAFYNHPELKKGPQPIDFENMSDYGKDTSFRALVRFAE